MARFTAVMARVAAATIGSAFCFVFGHASPERVQVLDVWRWRCPSCRQPRDEYLRPRKWDERGENGRAS